MRKQLIESALRKFPKARRIAVENFTIGKEGKGMCFEYVVNLDLDTRLYGWNDDTVSAIVWIIEGGIS